MVTENDEQPTKTSHQKWPQNDEVLLAQALISTSENPITGNNQNVDAFWKHGKYNSASHIHGFQPPKRTKTSSSGEYTSSASDANFGENPEITISLEDTDKEDFEVQLQQVTTTRPIGRDKAKAKAKLKGKAGIEPSEYDLRKLKLIDEISSTNRAKSEAIEKFEHRIDKFYEIEKKKLEMKQKKLRCKSDKYFSLTPLT
ncbi:hypothetical protein E3N88_22814 [Mikania micrantha]|uniref:No apical meristem-associated C-terminal domain-containing protein n=1 Tax=Mikania micrantha TaxID=192012 RepID=A0A5N6NCX8_9ASTR|nr:hypothetical protein E3N88_22814 [Mikania micrantha]